MTQIAPPAPVAADDPSLAEVIGLAVGVVAELEGAPRKSSASARSRPTKAEIARAADDLIVRAPAYRATVLWLED